MLVAFLIIFFEGMASCTEVQAQGVENQSVGRAFLMSMVVYTSTRGCGHEEFRTTTKILMIGVQ